MCFLSSLQSKATQPVLYVVAFSPDLSVKDVTRRYVVNWTTIKQRVDEVWWEKTLKPFHGKRTAQDREEDEELSDQMLNHPLPTVIGEYKVSSELCVAIADVEYLTAIADVEYLVGTRLNGFQAKKVGRYAYHLVPTAVKSLKLHWCNSHYQTDNNTFLKVKTTCIASPDSPSYGAKAM